MELVETRNIFATSPLTTKRTDCRCIERERSYLPLAAFVPIHLPSWRHCRHPGLGIAVLMVAVSQRKPLILYLLPLPFRTAYMRTPKCSATFISSILISLTRKPLPISRTSRHRFLFLNLSINGARATCKSYQGSRDSEGILARHEEKQPIRIKFRPMEMRGKRQRKEELIWLYNRRPAGLKFITFGWRPCS